MKVTQHLIIDIPAALKELGATKGNAIKGGELADHLILEGYKGDAHMQIVRLARDPAYARMINFIGGSNGTPWDHYEWSVKGDK